MPARAPVTFNIEDADLPELVRMISNITGRRFILPSKARSIKATVVAPTQVTAAEAYQAFLSILELNGMTVIPSGRFLKIVESAGIENQPIPVYPSGAATPREDRFMTHLHRLDNISSDDAVGLLTRFKSREGNVSPYGPTNTVILTDTGSNIRRMLTVLEAVDVPRSGEQIWIEPVHYARATDVVQTVQELFPGAQVARNAGSPGASAAASTPSAGSGESGVMKILADERSNSLILVATEKAYQRVLALIRELDVPLEGEGRVHVHHLQHGDAEDIASTLSGLVGGSGGRQGGAPPAGQQQGGGSNSPNAGIFEGEIRVNAHKPANALVITASLHDYLALRKVIDALDAPRRQVFIEAVIMELSVQRSNRLGVSFHGGLEDVPLNDALSIVGSNAGSSLSLTDGRAILANQDLLTGLAVGIRGPNIPNSQQLIGLSIPALGVVLTALATSGDVNVLSTPHIIAMDNTEAEITVGANVPLQTSGIAGGIGGLQGLLGAQAGAQPGAAQGGGLGLAALAGLGGGLGGLGMGGIPRQNVGTTIRVTPHVNESDEIRLEIQEEISEVQAPQGTLGVVPFSQRVAKTQVAVKDHETVVIGGLMRDRVTTSEDKVPILGDIPLLGVAFRRSTKQTEKTNLLLFLTPYVIRTPADLRAIFERKMRERQEFLDRYFVFGNRDYRPPIDYSRTRGLVGEVVTELDRVEEEVRLEKESRRKAKVHEPRGPIGAAADLAPASRPVAAPPAAPSGGSLLTPDDANTGRGIPTRRMPLANPRTTPLPSESTPLPPGPGTSPLPSNPGSLQAP